MGFFRKSAEQPEEPASTVETWGDRDAKVEVLQPEEGYMMRVALRAKVDLPPDQLYQVLVAPDNATIFKGIKRVCYRRVLEDDGNQQKVEVEQVARWKLLMFSGSFSTRLYVFQDRRRGTVEFRLARLGLMKDFAGTWRVQPFTQSTLDALGPQGAQQQQQHQHHAPWHSFAGSWHRMFGEHHQAQASLLSLEQSLEPLVRPPKPLEGLVKGIAVAQLRGILEDLREEVPRIKAGRPSLKGWSSSIGIDSGGSSSVQNRGGDDDTEEEAGHSSRCAAQQPMEASLACTSSAALAAPHGAAPDASKYVDWPGNSWWGALSGSKKQRKQALWVVTDMQDKRCGGGGVRPGAHVDHQQRRH